MSNRIKVVGYAQKVTFTDGIEYRNFTPDLVGNQLTSNGGTPLFTMGDFSITTNMDEKLDRFHNTAKFSNFITLSDLDLTLDESYTLLTDNAGVILNLDKTNIDYYSLFGSFSEFIRVSLEDIIIKWPASLYLSPVSQTTEGKSLNGYTVENYTYNELSEVSNFTVNTNFIINKFQINYTNSGSIINTFNETNDLRNLTINYASYVIYYNGVEYPVIDFSAATTNTNDYISFNVKGNPFSGVTTGAYIYYHIKPSKLNEEKFFNALPEFEAYLLNRNVTPLYSATFKYPIKSDAGVIMYITNKVTWPVSDGYNIDFDTTQYVDYVNKLLDISNSNDSVSSNLMVRFLVSESISDFDTSPVFLPEATQDESGQKINKTLQIYGREYDEINKFITGINYANTVTYDKQNNTPDIYLKNLARVLGWELVSSVIENNLLKSYVTTTPSSYSGQSVGLTAVEADVELWRRLILNTPWLWKSKGARKSIEFLLRFIGAPNGLITFNEYVYKAKAPIDVELFKQVLTLNGLNDDISIYPIDSDGYPRPLDNTTDMYFQNYGLWYRETGGTGSTVDIMTGNNPHVGPYDGGSRYINQFKKLIPNFEEVTISSETMTTDIVNLYTNYDLGRFNLGITTGTTVDTVDFSNEDGTDIHDCIVFTPSIVEDPNPSPVLNDCGCDVADSDNVLSLCVDSIRPIRPPACNFALEPIDTPSVGLYIFNYLQFDANGVVYTDSNGNQINKTSPFASKQCCTNIGGTPALYNQTSNGVSVNVGYVCSDNNGKCGCTVACKWMVNPDPIRLPLLTPTFSGPQQPYLEFTNEDGTKSVVTVDGCNCIKGYTTQVPNVIDPYSGEIGFGCQVTNAGMNDLAMGIYGQIHSFYKSRVLNGTCYN